MSDINKIVYEEFHSNASKFFQYQADLHNRFKDSDKLKFKGKMNLLKNEVGHLKNYSKGVSNVGHQ